MKKIVSLVALVAMLATAIFAMAIPAAAEGYDPVTTVTVIDTDGTSYNLITGEYKDSSVTYDAATSTLTLNNANLAYLNVSGAKNSYCNVIVVLKGTNTITAKATDDASNNRLCCVMMGWGLMTIKGDGTLNCNYDKTDIKSGSEGNTAGIYGSRGAFDICENVTLNLNANDHALRSIGKSHDINLTVRGNAKLNCTVVEGYAIQTGTSRGDDYSSQFTIADKAVVTCKVTEGDDSVGVYCNNLNMKGGELNVEVVGADYSDKAVKGIHFFGWNSSNNPNADLTGGKINVKVKSNNTDNEKVYGLYIEDMKSFNIKGTKITLDVATPKTGAASAAIGIKQTNETSDVAVTMTKGTLDVKADAKTPVTFVNLSESAKATVSITGGTYTGAAANAPADATNITVTVNIPAPTPGGSDKDEPSKTADASEVALAAIVAVASLGMMTAMVAKKKEF